MPDIDEEPEPKRIIGLCPKCGRKDFENYNEYLDHILDC